MSPSRRKRHDDVSRSVPSLDVSEEPRLHYHDWLELQWRCDAGDCPTEVGTYPKSLDSTIVESEARINRGSRNRLTMGATMKITKKSWKKALAGFQKQLRLLQKDVLEEAMNRELRKKFPRIARDWRIEVNSEH